MIRLSDHHYFQCAQDIVDKMKMNLIKKSRLSYSISWIVLLFLISCGTFAVDGTPSEGAGETLVALSTQLPPPVIHITEAPPAPEHPAAGLRFTNADGTWWIDREGEIQMLIDQTRAIPSPDGKWIAYVEADPVTDMGDIWLEETETGIRNNITNTPDRDEGKPIWVPNKPELILFGSDTETGRENSSYPTVVRVDGSGYQILDQDRGGLRDVSPDGEMFFYSGNEGTLLAHDWDSGVEIFDPADFDLTVEKLFIPSWSPDASQVAFFVSGKFLNSDRSQLGIAVFNLETRTAELMHVYEPIGGSEFVNYLVWSPDGEWLAFTTHNEPPATGRAPNLWVARKDGLDETYIGVGTVPTWRYDSKYFAYQSLNEAQTEEVFLVETGTWNVSHLDELPLPERILSLLDWVVP